MEVTAHWEGGYLCRVPVRQFEVVADEPPEYGGEDAGPAPTELFLASLATCFTMSVAYAARKMGVVLPDLAVTVRGHYRGPRFDRIRVEVSSSHPRAALDELVEKAAGYCYVSMTLRNAPEIEFAVAETHVHEAPPSPLPPEGYALGEG